jgi:hypothetical protein
VIGDPGGNLVVSLWPGDKETFIGLAAEQLTPPPKTSAGKFLASVFWDQDAILLIDCLPKGQIINAE